MKTIAFIITLAVAGTSVAQAQFLPSGWRLGLRGGATYAAIKGKDAEQIRGGTGKNDYKLGFNAGLSFQIPLSADGFWTLAPELLVNRKGYEREYETKDATNLALINATGPTPSGTLEKYESKDRRSLTYIELPIPVRINTASGGSGLYFELGPQVGYMARSSRENKQVFKYTNENTEKLRTDEGSAKEDLVSFDIGAIAGLGFQTESGFSLGVRYNQGLKTLFDTKDVSAKNEPRAFNQAYMAQIGYLLPLGK
ncbi:MAG: PorT family protein [Hymenobacter sp.]|nr:PorT family protein [Hymenobacter sp.]